MFCVAQLHLRDPFRSLLSLIWRVVLGMRMPDPERIRVWLWPWSSSLEEEIHGGGQGKRAFDRRAPVRFYNWQCFRFEIRVAVVRFTLLARVWTSSSDVVGLTMCRGISPLTVIVSLRYSRCTWRSVLSGKIYVNGSEREREEKRHTLDGETKPRRWIFSLDGTSGSSTFSLLSECFSTTQRSCRSIGSLNLSKISNQKLKIWGWYRGRCIDDFLFADRLSMILLVVDRIIDLRVWISELRRVLMRDLIQI